MDAINADPAWTAELRTKVETLISTGFHDKLKADSRARHDEDSRLIARNQRHVFLAYAAMWILAMGFVVLMWRRQVGLRGQLQQLKGELEAALKSDPR
jgi:hypothetical protein